MTVLGFVLLCTPGTRVHRVLTHAHRGSQSRPGTLVHRVLTHHTEDHRVDLEHEFIRYSYTEDDTEGLMTQK